MSRGLLYRGGLSVRTSARLSKAILNEFGMEDGRKIFDWLLDLMQAATRGAKPKKVSRKKRWIVDVK